MFVPLDHVCTKGSSSSLECQERQRNIKRRRTMITTLRMVNGDVDSDRTACSSRGGGEGCMV